MNQRSIIFHLIQLLFFILSSSSTVYGDVFKCCPSNSNLKIAENSVLGCEVSSIQNSFDAYNIKYSNQSSIPQCKYNLQKLFDGDERFATINGCVDRSTEGDLYAITCTDWPAVDIHELNRCCASGYSYDHVGRLCAPHLDSPINFKRYFNDALVLFKTKIPDCGSDEVFVEYISTTHDIHFNNKDLSVNGDILESGTFCIEGLVKISDNELTADHMIIRSCRPKTICGRIPCIRRCCKTDQIIKPGQCISHPNQMNFVPILHDIDFPVLENKTQTQVYVPEYGVLHSLDCKQGKSPLHPDETYYLHRNGTLFLGMTRFENDEYCIENTQIGSKIELRTFICLGYSNPDKFHYYPVGLIISCVFLALTLIVYLALPKLLNIHGKTLVCYVVSFLASYIMLVIVQMGGDKHIKFCYEIAFMLVYSFTAVFCWQTVMCFDIWLTFGSLRSSYVLRHNKRDHRKFWYYSAYAWGFPLLWTMFTLYASKYKPFPTEWNPSFGVNSCFFASSTQRKEHFLYFILPTGTHVLINSVLFVLTAIYCSRVKTEIHRMQSELDESTISAKRMRFIASRAMFVFIMNLKLFTVMGISWILEIISTYIDNPIIESIQDMYNIFLGVSIFIIFVFKRKVFQEFKSRIGLKSSLRGTETPRSTTTTHTMNVAMKDLSGKSVNDLPLLGTSAPNLNKIIQK